MFALIRQALQDYKVGRALRKKNLSSTVGDSPPEYQRDIHGAEDQVQHPAKTQIHGCREESINQEQSKPEIRPCREESQTSIPKAKNTQAKNTRKGWHLVDNPDAEFPWRGEFVIDGESSWRGTWILEVDDLGALDWEIERAPDETGQGGKYVRRMTRQWPFSPDGGRPVEGGQDDLMVYLGKP